MSSNSSNHLPINSKLFEISEAIFKRTISAHGTLVNTPEVLAVKLVRSVEALDYIELFAVRGIVASARQTNKSEEETKSLSEDIKRELQRVHTCLKVLADAAKLDPKLILQLTEALLEDKKFNRR